MSTIKGILFDKDGTLLDFNGSWLLPYKKAAEFLSNRLGTPDLANTLLEKGGYIATTESWISNSLLASGSNQQIIDFWGELMGETISGETLKTVRGFFDSDQITVVPAIDGLTQYCDDLVARGMILGLATMDDQACAQKTLQDIGVAKYFSFICGADSGYGVKPEPGMVFEFCKVCELKPNEVIMVGDSPRDVQMGINAGVAYSVGVLTGAQAKKDLLPFTKYVFQDITGVLSLI